jgi:glyoxylase-like metal-dependent hydrolase (beta-lactamase superfamily II)
VSSYEVLAVRYGTRTARRSEAFLNFGVYGEPDSELPMDYYFWVVRDAAHTVVVDCGFAAEPGRRRGRTTLAEPVEALRGLGIAPESVDRLVVSHAHYDHIGNLGAFPAAEIVIARREYEFWTGPYAGRVQFAHSTEAEELTQLAKLGAEGRLQLVDGTLDLAPGLELTVVGGHTPGQMVAQVAVDGGAAILAADAMHFYEELERDRPFFVVADLLEMYRGFDLLREMTTDRGRRLVAGHEAQVGTRFPDRLDGLPDGLGELVVRIAGPEGSGRTEEAP